MEVFDKSIYSAGELKRWLSEEGVGDVVKQRFITNLVLGKTLLSGGNDGRKK